MKGTVAFLLLLTMFSSSSTDAYTPVEPTLKAHNGPSQLLLRYPPAQPTDRTTSHLVHQPQMMKRHITLSDHEGIAANNWLLLTWHFELPGLLLVAGLTLAGWICSFALWKVKCRIQKKSAPWMMVSIMSPAVPANLFVYPRRRVPTIPPGAPMAVWEQQFIMSHKPFVPHRKLLLDRAFERRSTKQEVIDAVHQIASTIGTPAAQIKANVPVLASVAPDGCGKTTLLLLIWRAWHTEVTAAIRAQQPAMEDPVILFATFGDHNCFYRDEAHLPAAELVARRLWASYRGVRGVWEPAYMAAPRPPELTNLHSFMEWVRQEEAKKRHSADPKLIPVILLVDDVSQVYVPDLQHRVVETLATVQQEDLAQGRCTIAVICSKTVTSFQNLVDKGFHTASIQLPWLGSRAMEYCVQLLRSKFSPDIIPGAITRAERRMVFEVVACAGHMDSMNFVMEHDFNQRYQRIGNRPDQQQTKALVDLLLHQLATPETLIQEGQLFGGYTLDQLAHQGWVVYRHVDIQSGGIKAEVVPNAIRWIPLEKYRPKTPILLDWAEDLLWSIYKVMCEGERAPIPNMWEKALRPQGSNEADPVLHTLELWRVLPRIEILRAYAFLHHSSHSPTIEEVLPGAFVKYWPDHTSLEVQQDMAQQGIPLPGDKMRFEFPADHLLCQVAHSESLERIVQVVLRMYEAKTVTGKCVPVVMLQHMRLKASATAERVRQWVLDVHSRAVNTARNDCLNLSPGAYYAVVFYCGDLPPAQMCADLPHGTILVHNSAVHGLLEPFGGSPVLQAVRKAIARKRRLTQRTTTFEDRMAVPDTISGETIIPGEESDEEWSRKSTWPKYRRKLNHHEKRAFWKYGKRAENFGGEPFKW